MSEYYDIENLETLLQNAVDADYRNERSDNQYYSSGRKSRAKTHIMLAEHRLEAANLMYNHLIAKSDMREPINKYDCIMAVGEGCHRRLWDELPDMFDYFNRIVD